MKKILLISNTISHDGKLLNHCFDDIKKIVGKEQVLYIPFALNDWGEYEKLLKNRFAENKIKLTSIHHKKNFKKAILESKVIFVGGGNTFRLLKLLKRYDLIDVIRDQVNHGRLIYIGASAGINIVCPTIMTTNDMPIVKIDDFNGLSLIPFQINPHFIDTNIKSKHKMETREERIEQFLEENNRSVLGLREGSYLLLENGRLVLKGQTGGKLFIKGKKPKELRPKQLLNFLL